MNQLMLCTILTALVTSACTREERREALTKRSRTNVVTHANGHFEAMPDDSRSKGHASPSLEEHELEVPNGPVVLVAEYSGLNDNTESGRIIITALLKKGIAPLVSGSRGARV